MADQITVDGEEYISSKRAAESTGYAQDYIGQLARKGIVASKRIGGLWYLSLKSLASYRERADASKTASPSHFGASRQAIEAIVSFDGKDYISAPRAAEITGYHQDYVGQLAREGKVLSRQVGNRWYVERSGILAHKAQKDALLAAVQSESVGLSRSLDNQGGNTERLVNPSYNDSTPFFTYTTEKGDLLPFSSSEAETDLPQGSTWSTETYAEKDPNDRGEKIPIRVLQSRISPVRERIVDMPSTTSSYRPRKNIRMRESKNPILTWISGALATIVIVLAISYASVMSSARYAQIQPFGSESASALVSEAYGAISRVTEAIETWFVSEISYHRES